MTLAEIDLENIVAIRRGLQFKSKKPSCPVSNSRAQSMAISNLICAARGRAYFSRCSIENAPGRTRQEPAAPDTPQEYDKASCDSEGRESRRKLAGARRVMKQTCPLLRLPQIGGEPLDDAGSEWPAPVLGKDRATVSQQSLPVDRLRRTARRRLRHGEPRVPCPALHQENPAKDREPCLEIPARICRCHAKRSKRRNSARGRPHPHCKISQVARRATAPGEVKLPRTLPRPEGGRSTDENLAANRGELRNLARVANPFWPEGKKCHVSI